MCYIPREWVTKNKNYIDTYKVMYARGYGSKSNVITRALYAGKGEVCTQSYFIIGPIRSEQSAKNVEKYIKTKFVRALIRTRWTGHCMHADRFKFVPLQDFASNSDIDWNKPISDIDQQLYKKYGLTQEEIVYIESTINPMI